MPIGLILALCHHIDKEGEEQGQAYDVWAFPVHLGRRADFRDDLPNAPQNDQ